MVKLFEAEDLVSGSPVILKVVSRQSVVDPVADRRWDREARALLAIDSPFVIRCLDRVETAEAEGLVMESLDGIDLRSTIALNEPLDLEMVLSLGLQLARGLHACHLAEVVHRDLRPENVFVTTDGAVKIVNFALAGIENATTLTMTGTMFGEPEYAAPETFAGAPLDARVDTYSLGVTIWEMVVGRNPFQGSGIAQILEEKSTRELPRLSSHDASTPPWLDDLVAAMTACDPEDRPSSLGHVIRSLENRQRIALEGTSVGNCVACGYRLLGGIDFCPFCGVSTVPEDAGAEASVCVINAVGDRQATVDFLRRTFQGEPRKKLEVAFKKLPLALVEGITPDHSRWLVSELEKRYCVVESQSLPGWYFKQTSVVMTLMLSALLMLVTNVESFLPTIMPPETRLGTLIYGLGKLHYIFGCLLVSFIIVRQSGNRLRGQPWLWLKGAREFLIRRGGAENVLVMAGRLVQLLFIVGVIYLCAVILRGQALVAFRMIDLVSFSASQDGFRLPVSLLVGPLLLSSMIPLGILLLIIRLMGRVGKPPLYTWDSTAQKPESVLRYPADRRVLERLRAVGRSTDLDDLRFVIADTMEGALGLIRLKRETAALPTSALHDLDQRIQGAINTIADTGEDLSELGGRTSPEIRDALEKSVLRLRHKVIEEGAADSGQAAALLRDVEEQIIQWEADNDVVNRRLNALRVASGEVCASVAQLGAITAGAGDEERARRELFIFSESLTALHAAMGSPRELG